MKINKLWSPIGLTIHKLIKRPPDKQPAFRLSYNPPTVTEVTAHQRDLVPTNAIPARARAKVSEESNTEEAVD